MEHLRYSGRSDSEQRKALETIIRETPILMTVLEGLRQLDLPDWLLASGAIYNNVWNHLTGRPPMTGVKDIDVTYFEASDLSYEAEDRIIRRVENYFSVLSVPVEARNQARVHLWFPQKFNQPFEPLNSSVEMLERYASKTHAVAVRLEADDSMTIHAPFGLDDLFSFRVVPNHALSNNRRAHEDKARRIQSVWPEIEVFPW